MSVNKLYVEGRLDVECLNPILGGQVAIQRKGTKDDLHHIVRRERADGASVCYLRDRDFDTEPSVPYTAQIVVDRSINGVTHGYRWQRLDLEAYLLEPRLVSTAMGISSDELERELVLAATSLRDYEAARWTIAQVRAELPHSRIVRTRPPSVTADYEVPSDLSETYSWHWIRSAAQDFLNQASRALDVSSLQQQYRHYRQALPVKDWQEVLLWYSGKDLLCQMAALRMRLNCPQPSDFCSKAARWIQKNSTQAESLLPEWVELRRVLAI